MNKKKGGGEGGGDAGTLKVGDTGRGRDDIQNEEEQGDRKNEKTGVVREDKLDVRRGNREETCARLL